MRLATTLLLFIVMLNGVAAITAQTEPFAAEDNAIEVSGPDMTPTEERAIADTLLGSVIFAFAWYGSKPVHFLVKAFAEPHWRMTP